MVKTLRKVLDEGGTRNKRWAGIQGKGKESMRTTWEAESEAKCTRSVYTGWKRKPNRRGGRRMLYGNHPRAPTTGGWSHGASDVTRTPTHRTHHRHPSPTPQPLLLPPKPPPRCQLTQSKPSQHNDIMSACHGGERQQRGA